MRGKEGGSEDVQGLGYRAQGRAGIAEPRMNEITDNHCTPTRVILVGHPLVELTLVLPRELSRKLLWQGCPNPCPIGPEPHPLT